MVSISEAQTEFDWAARAGLDQALAPTLDESCLDYTCLDYMLRKYGVPHTQEQQQLQPKERQQTTVALSKEVGSAPGLGISGSPVQDGACHPHLSLCNLM